MTNPRRTGRIVGSLNLLMMLGAMLLNAVILAPIFKTPGFLTNAAAMPGRMTASILLNLTLAFVMLAIAIIARPIFKQVSRPLSLWYLVVVAVGIALTAIENVGLFTMLKVSQSHAAAIGAGATDLTNFELARTIAAAIRNAGHYTNVLVAGSAIAVLYIILWRGRLVPRALAGAGVIAALLQMTAVGAPFFGRPAIAPLLAPIALTHLALTIWLLAKGFAPPRNTEVAPHP